MKKFLLLSYLVLSCIVSYAQNPRVLKDVANFPKGSLPSYGYQFTNRGNQVIFVADAYETGSEVYALDKSTNSVSLLKDITPGIDPSYPSELTEMNGVVYFSASENINSYYNQELWMTDGTPSGTVLLKELNTDSGLNGGGRPRSLKAVGNTLFFAAYDSSGYELWKSDGTAIGTTKLKDINPGINNGFSFAAVNQQLFTSIGSSIYFIADNGTNGTELWTSDGTTNGTMMVKDINPGVANSDIEQIKVFGNTLYFVANDGTNGKELWKSDGTANGTVLVKDINSGAASSSITDLVYMNNQLYFFADDAINGLELWTSDGTTLGSTIVKDINGFSSGSIYVYLNNESKNLAVVGSELFFLVSDNGNRILWKSDGTNLGTVMVKDIAVSGQNAYFGSLQSINNTLYFVASDSFVYNYELWKSDGTSNGTAIVKDINPNGSSITGFTYSALSGLYPVGNNIYFYADNGTAGYELWKSDGTVGGTSMVKDIYKQGSTHSSNQEVSYQPIFDLGNGNILFIGKDTLHGLEIWTTDGTTTNTTLVADINTATDDLNTDYVSFHPFNNSLYFLSSVGNYTHNNTGVWKTDGTSNNTTKVKSILSRLLGFPEINNKLLFTTPNLPSNLSSLWAINSTTGIADTLVNQISLSTWGVSFSNNFYFSADTTSMGVELWKTDGTTTGTSMVKDINPSGSSSPSMFSVLNNALYFSANDGTNGSELWKSNGTATGTTLIKDINPGSGSSVINNTFVMGNNLYFTADNGTNGNELWKSDGTANGTMMLKDINPTGNAFFYNYGYLTELNNNFFFSATDNSTNYTLWKSDGTANGTVKMKDINVNYPGFVKFNNELFFIGADTSYNYYNSELWKSDGTEAGTVMVKDINQTNLGSTISQLILGGNRLYFVARDSSGVNGVYLSDGTEVNTYLLFNFDGTTVPFTSIQNLYYYPHKLFFTAATAGLGQEIWVYDLDSSTISVNVLEGTDAFASLYPNPNNGEFTIELDENTDLMLQITNVSGQLIKSAQIQNTNNLKMNVQDLPQGIYFVSLFNDKQRQVIKFIKH